MITVILGPKCNQSHRGSLWDLFSMSVWKGEEGRLINRSKRDEHLSSCRHLGSISAAAGILLLILFGKVRLYHGPSENCAPCSLDAPWTGVDLPELLYTCTPLISSSSRSHILPGAQGWPGFRKWEPITSAVSTDSVGAGLASCFA